MGVFVVAATVLALLFGIAAHMAFVLSAHKP